MKHATNTEEVIDYIKEEEGKARKEQSAEEAAMDG